MILFSLLFTKEYFENEKKIQKVLEKILLIHIWQMAVYLLLYLLNELVMANLRFPYWITIINTKIFEESSNLRLALRLTSEALCR